MTNDRLAGLVLGAILVGAMAGAMAQDDGIPYQHAAQSGTATVTPGPTEYEVMRVMYRLCLQREATAVAIETAAPCIARRAASAYVPLAVRRW